MVALSVQQSFWSVFRNLRIKIAVHIYVISQSPCTTKTFAQNIFINMHLGSPMPARSKVMVCLPEYLYFTDCRNLCKLHPQMIVLFAKAVQHQLHCRGKFKSLQNSNANFPQTHSWWNIRSQGHQVNMWNDQLKYCCQLSNLAPLSFSSHPRGVIDKI